MSKQLKIAILAADSVKLWDRHSQQIKGETLLEHTVRQLNERGYENITLSLREGRTVVLSSDRKIAGFVNNPLTGNDMGCIYGIKEHNFDLYIFGDVYFSEAGIDAVLSSTDEFYGRTKAGKTKNYGEMFAMKSTPRFMAALEKCWKEYKAGTRKRLWSWDLYSAIQGKDFYKHRNTGNFTEINDETEDFDKPGELDWWRTKYEIT